MARPERPTRAGRPGSSRSGRPVTRGSVVAVSAPKKRNFFDRAFRGTRKFVADRGREVEEIATGAPAGVYAVAKALDQALPSSPIKKLERASFEKEGKHLDPTELKKVGKQMWEQTKNDLKNPTENPTSTFLTILGLASLGTGTAARALAGASAVKKTGKISTGARAALGPQVNTRKFKGIAKRPGEFSRVYKDVPASNSAPLRVLRKGTLDVAYNISRRRAEKANVKPKLKKGARVIDEDSADFRNLWDAEGNKRVSEMTDPKEIEAAVRHSGYEGVRKKSGNIKLYDENAKKALQPGAYARRTERRERDLRARMHRESRGGNPDEFGEPKEVKARAVALDDARRAKKGLPPNPAASRFADNRPKNSKDWAKWAIGAPMNVVRASMYVRPRYAVQNLMGTAQLLAHQGGNLPRNVKLQQQIRKLDPEAYERIKNMSGVTGAQSIAQHATGPGTDTVRRLGNIAQKPEEWTRPLGIIDEMYKTMAQGGRKVTAQDLAKFAMTTNKEGISRLHGAQRRGLEEMIDYGRLGDVEKAFMKTQIPIFYPMFKGFARYGANFASRHPIQAGAGAQLGNFGKEQQMEGFGGLEPPSYAPYAFSPEPGKTLNPQNMYTFSPSADIMRQLGQSLAPGGGIPGLNLLANTGPLPNLAVSALGGSDLATGWQNRGIREKGQSAAGSALREFIAQSAPFSDIVRSTGWNPGGIYDESKAYAPMTIQEQLLYNLLGPWAVERRTNMPKFLKQSKQNRKMSRERDW